MTITESSTGCAAHAGKYLTFLLGHEHYGIPVLKVREIIRYCDITHVPRMPDYIKGVINLRGKIIPVLDLCARFELPPPESTERVCIVVIHVQTGSSETQVGFVVSGVDEVVNIGAQEIEDPPRFGGDSPVDYILAVAKVRGTVKMLLDVDRVLNASAAALVSQTEKPTQP